MSSFACPRCGTMLIDIPGKGYTTECIHFPLRKKVPTDIPDFMKELFNIK